MYSSLCACECWLDHLQFCCLAKVHYTLRPYPELVRDVPVESQTCEMSTL